MAPFEIRWSAPEFEYRQKSISWYWLTIIVATIILGLAIWQKNFLFGFFVVTAEILVLTWSVREPRLLEFTLNEKGLDINKNNFYGYDEMEKFSAETADVDWSDLVIFFRRKLRPALKIKTPKETRARIVTALKTILLQVEYEPSLLDNIEEFVGF